MFDHFIKYTKLLILILLGLFFMTFVIDEYADEPQKTKCVFAESFMEMDADESECEDDDLAEEAIFEQYALIPKGIDCVFIDAMQLSSSKQSTEQYRGLVRRYAPRPATNYINLFKNGTDLIRGCAIFYSENQILKI